MRRYNGQYNEVRAMDQSGFLGILHEGITAMPAPVPPAAKRVGWVTARRRENRLSHYFSLCVQESSQHTPPHFDRKNIEQYRDHLFDLLLREFEMHHIVSHISAYDSTCGTDSQKFPVHLHKTCITQK